MFPRLKNRQADVPWTNIIIAYRILDHDQSNQCLVAVAIDSCNDLIQSCVCQLDGQSQISSIIWAQTVVPLLSHWKEQVDDFEVCILVTRIGELKTMEANDWNMFLRRNAYWNVFNAEGLSTDESESKRDDVFENISAVFLSSCKEYSDIQCFDLDFGKKFPVDPLLVTPMHGSYRFLDYTSFGLPLNEVGLHIRVCDTLSDSAEMVSPLARASILVPEVKTNDRWKLHDSSFELTFWSVASERSVLENLSCDSPSFRNLLNSICSLSIATHHLSFVQLESCVSAWRYPAHFTLVDRICAVLEKRPPTFK